MKLEFALRPAAAAAILALAGAFQPAAADTLTVNGMQYTPAATVHIPALNKADVWAYAGAFSATNSNAPSTSFAAYCVDTFRVDQQVSSYQLVSAASIFGNAKADDLNRLATGFYGQVTNARTSAAFQLAAWEIVNEEAGNPYNLGANKFQAWNGSNGTADIALAQQWLAAVPGQEMGYAVNVWKGDTSQNLAIFAPVPEPETYAMILAGLGLIGFVAKRRKQ